MGAGSFTSMGLGTEEIRVRDKEREKREFVKVVHVDEMENDW